MMKRMLCMLPAMLLWAGAPAPVSADPAPGDALSVQVQETQLRDRPSFLGKAQSNLAYADRVTLLALQGAWMQVQVPGGGSGWVHSSSLTEKKIVLKAGAEDVQAAASSEELALAGKGFNSDVESEFKRQNAEIDFTWIDRMEGWDVKQNDIESFLKKGGLAE